MPMTMDEARALYDTLIADYIDPDWDERRGYAADALKATRMPPSAWDLWNMLDMHRRDTTGYVTISHKRLCEVTGLHIETVRYTLRRMAKAGLLKIHMRPGRTTTYDLSPTWEKRGRLP